MLYKNINKFMNAKIESFLVIDDNKQITFTLKATHYGNKKLVIGVGAG